MQRLKQRADFLATAAGKKLASSAFVLQTRARGDEGPVRVGFTVTKKTGNAVERNRIRRRLREVIRKAGDASLQAGHDYVLIGRRAALKTPFDKIADDFAGAISRIHNRRQSGK